MPDVTIKLESIGDDHREKLHLWRQGRLHMSENDVRMCKSLLGRRPFVKLVTGVNQNGMPRKKNVKGHKDFSQAIGTGGRGVFYWFTLAEGQCYQIQHQLSWRKVQRLSAVVRNGVLIEATQKQVSTYMLAQSDFRN